MDFLALTKRYYATWVDVDPALLDRKGMSSVYSPKRDRRQVGYGRQFDLYCLVSQGTTVISYGQRLREAIGDIERCFAGNAGLDGVKAALHERLSICPQHSFKYCFTALPAGLDTSRAKRLAREDYPDFLCFHRRQYPQGNQETWLEDYFCRIADKGYVYGVYAGQRLVSTTDAPDVPYMRDLVVEPGIATLPAYRRRGYAKAVVGTLLTHLLKTSKVPLWSCSASNVASQRLAESVGYVRFADVITITC